MHDAWFNSADSGVSVPTNIPYVFPDMYTIDPYSNEPVVNPNTSLLTIVDNDNGLPYPVGKTVKFRVAPKTQTIDPVLNTSAFNTYATQFTLYSIIGQAAINNPVIVISVKVFDPVNGDSGQINTEFQTRNLPQG